MTPLFAAANELFEDLLAPLHLPRYPMANARFGIRGIRSAWGLAQRWFATERAKAMFAGLAAHSVLPLKQPPSAAVALMLLVAAHRYGWPMPRGGAQAIADALAGHFRSLGGRIELNHRVNSIDEFDKARVVLLDLSPSQILNLAGHRFTERYRNSLQRYRYNPGVFKVDWALQHPIPWNDPVCSQAATVHLGGTIAEIEKSEATVWAGNVSSQPFVLLVQQTLFDPSRAPPGKHTAWAYCHVPHGSAVDVLERIESQVAFFAHGFRDCILERHVLTPAALEQYNANYVGGDINGGVQDLGQLFSRPVSLWKPYRTHCHRVYICSASTPPGGGVHGMCGYHAARLAIAEHFK